MSVHSLDHSAHQEMVDSSPAGEVKKTSGSSFYRGENSNFNPYGKDQTKPDFAGHFVLKGWLPERPFISNSTAVTAFGSCFAENISNHLASIGYNTSKERQKDIYVSSMGEGLVNVHSISQQFRWALEGWEPPSDLWHGYDAKKYDLDELIREKTKQVFLNTDVFILTFGLSEIWYDETTSGVFWRAVPMTHYDPSRHKFRVCSFAETKECIDLIIRLIDSYVPRAKIIMTLSPIPLIATFRSTSCITSNYASKSVIKAALDEIMRNLTSKERENIYYFPAFELINECFPNRFVEDGRHLHQMIVPSIMRLFEANFCETPLTPSDAEIGFRQARLDAAKTILQHPLFQEAFQK